ncbi:hypothetical protein ACVSMD_07470, partial [Pseudomonas aeruginosa]
AWKALDRAGGRKTSFYEVATRRLRHSRWLSGRNTFLSMEIGHAFRRFDNRDPSWTNTTVRSSPP